MNINPRLVKEAKLEKGWMFLSICLGAAGGILSIVQAYLLSKSINRVFLEGKNLMAVVLLLAAILLIIASRAVITWAEEKSAGTAARRIKQNIQQRLFAHLQALGPYYLKGQDSSRGTQTGELVNLATEGIDQLEVYFSQYLPQIALAVLIPLSILIFVFPTDLLSGVVLLVTAPLIPIFMYLIGNTSQALTRKQWLGLSRMGAYFLDILQGLTTLKALGRSREQTGMVEKVSDQYRRTTMGVLKVTFTSALIIELVATLSTAVIAVEIGLRLLYGRIGFEQAFFILLLAPEFYLPLRLLSTRFHASMAGNEAAQRVYGLLDLPTLGSIEPSIQKNAPHPIKNLPPSITYKDISFAYSPNRPSVDQVSLEIPPGKITALTGPSGSGKTTLTWLLLRFLTPQSGEILVNGQPLGEIPLEEWRDGLAWVPQNPYLFNDTVLANIKLARPDADQAVVLQAAMLAHADEFIREMPAGYDTIIGERGVRLSAGQAQRIAIARALLKDAPLLILDEPTSHLDPETDAKLQDSIRQLVHRRTVLIIAHHRNTLQLADRVVELRQGRVAGTKMVNHDEKTADNNDLLPAVTRVEMLNLTDTVASTERIKKEPGPTRHPGSTSRLFSLLRPFWGRVTLSVFLGAAAVISSVGLMATAAFIISAAALHPSIADLQVAIVGVRFFGLARGVFRYLERLVSHDVTLRLLARWRVRFYQALEPLAPARLMGYHSGDLLARVIRDINTLENFYIRALNPPLVAAVVSVAVVLFLARLNILLAFGLLIILILGGVFLPLLSWRKSRQIGPDLVQARSQLNTFLVDSLQGMPDLLASGQGNRQLERVSQAGMQLNRLQQCMADRSAWQNAAMNMLANLAMFTVLVVAIRLVSMGELSGVLLGAVSLTAYTCFEAIQPLPQVTQNYAVNQAAADRLYELVDTQPEVHDPLASVKWLPGSSLVVNDLTFRYPLETDSDQPVEPSAFNLQGVSFTLPHANHIALIGPSGAGKTTLVNVLQRFWDYQQGSIRIGEHEMHEFQQEEIRAHLAVISQNAYLFSATIQENLLIARPQATAGEIIAAARHAQLHDFILELPSGYETWIGEHGLRLSAGERQRLSIARAFLKDAPMLILDEPTVNLDPAIEHALLVSIQELSKGRSTLTITQRMEGLENMDEILVLQNGCIIERGKHEQLMANRGCYRKMVEIYHHIV